MPLIPPILELHIPLGFWGLDSESVLKLSLRPVIGARSNSLS